MRNPSGHRVEKSQQLQVRHFLHNTCDQEFLKVSRCGRPQQRQRNVQKSVRAARAKLFFLLNRPIVVFFAVLFAFAAWHHMILYFVRENYKYYRELHPQPWLNLYIRDILAAQLTDTLTGYCRFFSAQYRSPQFLPQVTQVRSMSIGEHRHCCVTFKI